jgi:excisionase family DNA binding protein
MPNTDESIPFYQRQTCTVKEACAAIPCGRTHLYRMIQAGRIKVEKLGSKTLIVISSLPGSSRKAA